MKQPSVVAEAPAQHAKTTEGQILKADETAVCQKKMLSQTCPAREEKLYLASKLQKDGFLFHGTMRLQVEACAHLLFQKT